MSRGKALGDRIQSWGPSAGSAPSQQVSQSVRTRTASFLPSGQVTQCPLRLPAYSWYNFLGPRVLFEFPVLRIVFLSPTSINLETALLLGFCFSFLFKNESLHVPVGQGIEKVGHRGRSSSFQSLSLSTWHTLRPDLEDWRWGEEFGLGLNSPKCFWIAQVWDRRRLLESLAEGHLS